MKEIFAPNREEGIKQIQELIKPEYATRGDDHYDYPAPYAVMDTEFGFEVFRTENNQINEKVAEVQVMEEGEFIYLNHG